MTNKPFLIIIGFFALLTVLIVTFIVLRSIGGSYGEGIDSLLTQTPQEQSATREKRLIRRIIVDEEEQCLEITPDGVVRTYASCGGELIDTNRLFDPKRIIELFEYTSRINAGQYITKPPGASVRIIIETENGTEIVYIPISPGADSISQVIDLIKGDLPQPTPTTGPTAIPTPTLPGTTIIPTATPAPTLPPGVTPTNTLTVTPKPFVCDYRETAGSTRPYYVSNFICTSQPSPAP